MGYGKSKTKQPRSLLTPKWYFSPDEASEQRNPLSSLLVGQLVVREVAASAPKSAMHSRQKHL